MYRTFTMFFLLLLLTTGSMTAQEFKQIPPTATPLTISQRVGIEIDSIDILYYRLFTSVRNVSSARAYSLGSDNVLFLLKRSELADTIINTSVENATTHLRYYIENIEHINESSVYSKIPVGQIAHLALARGYEGRSYKDISISLTKRDSTHVEGELLMITYNAIVISQRSGEYDWRTVNNGLHYIYFNEIDRIDGAPLRYYRGNDQLIWKYLFSLYANAGNTSYFMVSDQLPIPSEVRKLIRKGNSSLEKYPTYASLDSLERITTPSNKFSISISAYTGLSKYLTQHSRNWGNQPGIKFTDSYENSLYTPIELSIGYTLLNNHIGDRWALTGSVSAFVNSDILSSDNEWISERASVQLHYFISPRKMIHYSGFDFSVFLGADASWTEYSGVFKREQGTSELPIDNILYPMTFKISSVFATTGLRFRYHLNDVLSVSIHAVGNFIIDSSVPDPVKLSWGKFGRNLYKTIRVAVPDGSNMLGTTISISM